MVMSVFGEGGGALCICRVFGLQIISETRCPSTVTHFMSTVRADEFCPMDRTICSVFKVNLPIFPFTFAFQSTVFFPNANPASSSSDSLSYSSAALWIKTTGATDGRKSHNAHFFFFIPSVNCTLKKLMALRVCCVINALLS